MNDAEKLAAATSILEKLTGGYCNFEQWPEKDGWLVVDTQVDLNASETRFLSTVKKPDETSGPGGMPDDFEDDEGLA